MPSVTAGEEKRSQERANGTLEPPEPKRTTAGKSLAAIAILAAAAFALALYFGLRHQRAVREELAADVRANAATPVSVIHPQSSASQLNVTFPANLQGYIETPIYARTSGYIKRWLVDIGARVQPGQLLAEIETPELDQQLRQAEAAQAQAQANLDLARVTATRYQNLVKVDGVSQQEVDQANGTLQADEANLKAAMATVGQLKDLQSFEKVTAPFAGTITARYIDIGSLIAAGNNTVLFRLAQTSSLRVYVNVPETYGPDIAPGTPADVEVPEVAGKKFAGQVVRTAGAIDPVSRTLLTEVHVPNPSDELAPGQFGEVTFHLRSTRPTLIIPTSALLFRAQGTQVALVEDEGKVHIQDIRLGRDLGNSVEVLAGLRPDDSIIATPSDSITDGVLVVVQPPSQPPASETRPQW
ncbi:MAG TPA: efflux RND transporter periplasmic adaptor subunit [Terriglobia bacterium]